MTVVAEALIHKIEASVSVLEQRHIDLTKKLDNNLDSTSKVKESVQEIAIYIAEISQKVSTYTTIHGESKSRIDTDLKDLWDRTGKLLEQRYSTTQLNTDIQTVKLKLEKLKYDIVLGNDNAEKLFSDADKATIEKCKLCNDMIEERFTELKDWMTDVDIHMDDGKKLKYGLQGVYLALIIASIILGIIGIKFDITPKHIAPSSVVSEIK